MISDKMFQKIFDEVLKGLSYEELANKYGKKWDQYIDRVEKAVSR